MTRTAQRSAGLGTGRRIAMLAAAAMSAASGAAGAQPREPLVSGYVTLTSDYRQRGLSESRGKPSLEIGGDFQHRSGFFAGAWAARIETSPDDGDDTVGRYKAAYYAGYTRRISRWSWTASAARYAYPGSGTTIDYDYDELSATVAYRDRVFATASYVGDLFSQANGWYGEIGLVFPLPKGLELGATLGRLDASRPALDYTHWNAGVSRTFARRIAVDVRRYDTSRYYSNAVATTRGDSWVVSASYAF